MELSTVALWALVQMYNTTSVVSYHTTQVDCETVRSAIAKALPRELVIHGDWRNRIHCIQMNVPVYVHVRGSHVIVR